MWPNERTAVTRRGPAGAPREDRRAIEAPGPVSTVAMPEITQADGRFLPSGDEAGTAPGDRKFRPDVEGLRAVAVLLVVLFHADVPWLTGGFVGVDVFFVLSGFVITGLLLRERANERRHEVALLSTVGAVGGFCRPPPW